MNTKIAYNVFKVVLKIWNVVKVLIDKIPEGVDTDEAETIGMQTHVEVGNIKIKVKKQDVLDEKTQKYFFLGFARLIRNIVHAFRK